MAIPLGVSQPSFAIRIVDADLGVALNPERAERRYLHDPSRDSGIVSPAKGLTP